MNIPRPEDILADKASFDKLDPVVKASVILSCKTNLDTRAANLDAALQLRIDAIVESETAIIAPIKRQAKELKKQAEDLVKSHAKIFFDEEKTLTIAGHVISSRSTSSVACDREEADVIAGLEILATDPEATEGDRMAAEACLNRGTPTLNKPFIRKAAAKSAAWLRAMGLFLSKKESITIKPINAKEADD